VVFFFFSFSPSELRTRLDPPYDLFSLSPWFFFFSELFFEVETGTEAQKWTFFLPTSKILPVPLSFLDLSLLPSFSFQEKERLL